MSEVINTIIKEYGLQDVPKIIVGEKLSEDNSLSYSDFVNGVICSEDQIVDVIINSCNNDCFVNNKIVVLSDRHDNRSLISAINEKWNSIIYNVLNSNETEIQAYTGGLV